MLHVLKKLGGDAHVTTMHKLLPSPLHMTKKRHSFRTKAFVKHFVPKRKWRKSRWTSSHAKFLSMWTVNRFVRMPRLWIVHDYEDCIEKRPSSFNLKTLCDSFLTIFPCDLLCFQRFFNDWWHCLTFAMVVLVSIKLVNNSYKTWHFSTFQRQNNVGYTLKQAFDFVPTIFPRD